MITLKDIFITYWNQITILLFGVGFLIKWILDIRAKKNEINYNLFQQKRLDAVNTFFANYSKTDHLWKNSMVWDILENKINATEIDNILSPILSEIQRNTLELQIYFTEKEHKIFSKISENIHSINGKLQVLYFSNLNTSEKSKEFIVFREEKSIENNKLFWDLSHLLKKTFK